MNQKLLEYIRTGQLMKFYKSKEWQSVREKALERDNYECQLCKENGKVTTIDDAKLEVHHIKEVKTHPLLALSLSNLKTLCVSCHNEEHDRLKEFQVRKRFTNEERW